jgi:hypothetical protein
MDHDQYTASHPENDTRPFPCTCKGPTMPAREAVEKALQEMMEHHPTPLPLQAPRFPVLYRSFAQGCPCVKDYFSLTNQVLDAIRHRKEATNDTFIDRNHKVRDLLYHFTGEAIRR